MIPRSGPNHGADLDNRPIYPKHLIGRTMPTPNARGILCSHWARDTAFQSNTALDVAPRARGTGASHF